MCPALVVVIGAWLLNGSPDVPEAPKVFVGTPSLNEILRTRTDCNPLL